jgi:predicted metal-binding membrane protein
VSEAALERLVRRDRAIVIAALAVLTVLSWAYTIWLANSADMGGMPMPKPSDMGMPMPMPMPMSKASGTGAMLAPGFKPWTATDFVVMFVMWAVMMVGMMTPSAAPMILVYARVGRQASSKVKPLAATGFFAAGYLLAWTAFSLAATIGQWLLERAALLTHMGVTTSSVLGGAVLILAGLFQWTPAKNACLKHCQSPLSLILQYGFRSEVWGSLGFGFRHGIFCIGCCWALMALLFVGGVMNIIWIAGLTIFILLEKVVPLGRIISRTAGAGLLGWGAWLLVTALK